MNGAVRKAVRCVGMLLAVLMFVGCASVGGLSEKSSARVRLGMTESEVHKIFGVPRRSVLSSEGRKVELFGVVYRRPMVASREEDSSGVFEVRALSVLYGLKGEVEKTAYSVGESRYRYSWLRPGLFEATAGSPIPQGVMHQIQKGVTARSELVRLCGKPTIVGFNEDGDTTLSWLFVHDRQRGFFAVQEFLVLLDADSLVADYVLRDTTF